MSEAIKDQNLQVLVEVIAVDNKSGKSKSGSDYSMEVCQCIVRGEKVLVGELILPKGHPIPVPGVNQRANLTTQQRPILTRDVNDPRLKARA